MQMFRWVCGVISILICGTVLLVYATSGYHYFLLFGICVSIACAICALVQRASVPSVSWKDGAVGLLLLCGGLLLYTSYIYTLPWQVNTDEVTIMLVTKRLLADHSTDVLGLSFYFGFPSFIFVLFGHLANLIGGIDLYHFRLLHSLFGVGSIVLLYVLFRQWFGRFKSLVGAILLGTNHALFAISRMAMRDNTGLFLELLALVLLSYGHRTKNLVAVLLGGVVTGLGFYTYFPGRIVIVIWSMAFFGFTFLGFSKLKAKLFFHQCVVFLWGFVLVALPVVLATITQPKQAFEYQKQQFLLYPEGRALEQTWTGAADGYTAWKINIKKGLLMFNKPFHDEGYIYPNYDHGFVDGISGVLVWIGLVVVCVRLCTKKRTLLDMVSFVGFTVLYLSFAFLITKAPNYTRLLIILPFVVYCIVEALWVPVGLWQRFMSRSHRISRWFVTALCVIPVVVGIVYLNAHMFRQFALAANAKGNDVGGTARFVADRTGIRNHTWVIAADTQHMYYSWGDAWQWKDWLGFFSGPTQQTVVVAPGNLEYQTWSANTTIFMNDVVWRLYKPYITYHHPRFTVTNITPDGRLIAIDILR